MEMTRRKFRLGWFGLMFLASIMMFGCGGGGGDDGGAAPQPAPTVPDSVNFTISQSVAVPLMRADVELEDNFTVELLSITAPGVQGTLTRSTEDLILNAGAFSFRTTAPGFTNYTSISVGITEPIAVRGDNNPTAGQLDIVITTTEPNPEYTYLVLNFSAAGIRIRTYTQQGGPPIAVGGDVQLTWQQFDDLLDTDPENQLFARFCYGIWNFLLEQVGIAFDAMEKIMNNEAGLADGTEPVQGDILPWNQVQRGTIVINSSGSGVQPGFDFELIFANWWVDDPTDDIDDFYLSGSLELLGYIENDGGPIGGDFNFVNFVRQETENNQAPTADQTTVNGGFALLVDW